MAQALIMPSLVCTLLKYAAEVGKVQKGYSHVIFFMLMGIHIFMFFSFSYVFKFSSLSLDYSL